ncbi:MAG: prolipoprotein diacylglyceryl transferase [Bdellovibrionales bacterium]|nr:prolipoprotein diacylglyceryl transferase [Bdellovibrionales bacterium]
MTEYIHNLDPFAIQFSESFGIRWYGLAYIFGFFICYYLTFRLTQKNKTLLRPEQVSDFIAFLAFGTMIGGRLGYCLFYDPKLLVSFSPVYLFGISFPMWDALAIWHGGMASHGGIIGIIFACVLYGRLYKLPIFHLLDLTTFAGALAIGFGRIANFINGELYGRACEGKCVWPVKFPDELHRWLANWEKYKVQLKSLYPVVKQLGGIAGPEGQLLLPTATKWQQWVESGSKYYVESYVKRIFNAIAQNQQQILKDLGEILTARHPSQLYQSVMEGFLVFIVMVIVWRKPQKPGVLAASWGVTYALMRILGEQFRMPDAHIGYQLWGLTRGQWLSMAMLIGSVVLLFFVLNRNQQKMGGWR